MTENKKLRELLYEARVRMPNACNYPACNGDGLRECCLSARIDEVLAEPVDDYDIDADLRQHKEDRLRLRAENMRLTREAVGAFRAGAKAMREKAADYIKNNIVGDQASMILAARVYEKEVRSLPLPEDE